MLGEIVSDRTVRAVSVKSAACCCIGSSGSASPSGVCSAPQRRKTLAHKSGREKGFSLGFFDADYIARFPCGVVEAGGNIVGGTLIVLGVLGLGVGVPLLGVGGYRFSKYQKWKRGEVSLRPSMNRTMHGTYTSGFTLRF